MAEESIESNVALSEMKEADEGAAVSAESIEAARAEFPEFDPVRELADPRFVHLISPEVGLTPAEAYHLIHRREIRAQDVRRAAQEATERLTDAILAGARRPEESGLRARQNPPAAFDYRRASPAEREELKRRIRSAAARGEKVLPLTRN